MSLSPEPEAITLIPILTIGCYPDIPSARIQLPMQ